MTRESAVSFVVGFVVMLALGIAACSPSSLAEKQTPKVSEFDCRDGGDFMWICQHKKTGVCYVVARQVATLSPREVCEVGVGQR